MLFSRKKRIPPVCWTSLRRSAMRRRKTGEPVEQKSKFYWPGWLRWLFPITGLLALIWFLVRVIPKPSRATYPCQRVAFPLASGFIVWLLGLAGSVAAYRKAKRSFAQARYVLAAICIAASVGFIWAALSSTDEKIVYANEPRVTNSPEGIGRGIHPGRVAWIHDPNATSWPGGANPFSLPYWWDSDCTNQQVVTEMLSKALRVLTGETSDSAAWDAVFRYFNKQKGKGDVGYKAGEKIAIKINWVLSNNPTTMEKTSPYLDRIDNSPQLAIALLKQLTDAAGVSPGNISIGDPGRVMPNYWYNMVYAECPGVVYLTVGGYSGSGRTIVTLDTNAPFYWSDPCDAHWVGVTNQDYIPTHFSQADYFINFAILKSHNDGGITVCGKNNYGSLKRNPNASGYYDMHWTRATETPGMGHYRAIVDLLGHPKLGGKTLLCLIDGLYGGQSWDSMPIRYLMAPFNHDWPSSIFLSQDPVAIDSVADDFLWTELDGSHTPYNDPYPEYPLPHYSGTDDYLSEAALVPNPPSGTNYDPNHNGGLTQSLGVHEHWNNATDKKYSRNLDPVNGTGIQLVTKFTLMSDLDNDGNVDFKDFSVLAAAWLSQPGQPNWNADCDISIPKDNIIDEYDLKVFCDNWLM
jgi:hypothetical protein